MPARTLDCRGLSCPLPVLKARKTLMQMDEGETLHVLATDPRSDREFALFCEEAGYQLLSAFQNDRDEWEIVIGCG